MKIFFSGLIALLLGVGYYLLPEKPDFYHNDQVVLGAGTHEVTCGTLGAGIYGASRNSVHVTETKQTYVCIDGHMVPST